MAHTVPAASAEVVMERWDFGNGERAKLERIHYGRVGILCRIMAGGEI
jgi:hypothetical protein